MIHGVNDERAIRYETAMEILNTMISVNTRMRADEVAKSCPDLQRLRELEEERKRLVIERRILDPDDGDACDRIFSQYARIVKNLLSAHHTASVSGPDV